MDLKQNVEQAGKSIIDKISVFFQPIKFRHVASLMIPFLILYPRPLMILLKPIIQKWLFYYRKSNLSTNRPVEIILSTDSKLSFKKQYLKSFEVLKGQMPSSFQKIKFFLKSQQILNTSKDESVKQRIVQKKHEFEEQNIINSCHTIDLFNKYHSRNNQQNQFIAKSVLPTKLSFIKSEIRFKNQQCFQIEVVNHETNQIDYLWLETILLRLKLLQYQNNSQVIKYVLIKAKQNILRLLQAQLLGINISESFKLSSFSDNKLHLLKLNIKLNSYEQCSITFKNQPLYRKYSES